MLFSLKLSFGKQKFSARRILQLDKYFVLKGTDCVAGTLSKLSLIMKCVWRWAILDKVLPQINVLSQEGHTTHDTTRHFAPTLDPIIYQHCKLFLIKNSENALHWRDSSDWSRILGSFCPFNLSPGISFEVKLFASKDSVWNILLIILIWSLLVIHIVILYILVKFSVRPLPKTEAYCQDESF